MVDDILRKRSADPYSNAPGGNYGFPGGIASAAQSAATAASLNVEPTLRRTRKFGAVPPAPPAPDRLQSRSTSTSSGPPAAAAGLPNGVARRADLDGGTDVRTGAPLSVFQGEATLGGRRQRVYTDRPDDPLLRGASNPREIAALRRRSPELAYDLDRNAAATGVANRAVNDTLQRRASAEQQRQQDLQLAVASKGRSVPQALNAAQIAEANSKTADAALAREGLVEDRLQKRSKTASDHGETLYQEHLKSIDDREARRRGFANAQEAAAVLTAEQLLQQYNPNGGIDPTLSNRYQEGRRALAQRLIGAANADFSTTLGDPRSLPLMPKLPGGEVDFNRFQFRNNEGFARLGDYTIPWRSRNQFNLGYEPEGGEARFASFGDGEGEFFDDRTRLERLISQIAAFDARK